MKTDNEIIAEFMGLKEEKEYLLLEWTTDHANVSWWSHSSCVAEWGNNIEDWHCEIRDQRMKTPAYDTSWDWLMAVVEKINEPEVVDERVMRSCAEVTIFYKACQIEYTPDEESGDPCTEEFEIHTQGDHKIEAVYNAAVAFIKWHNAQTSVTKPL